MVEKRIFHHPMENFFLYNILKITQNRPWGKKFIEVFMIYEATFDNQILVAQLRASVQKSKKSLFF